MYVILLDGYPRADVLDYAFDIDNSAFLDALAERGFTVARDSHSDYLWTHVSVPSALNLAYVEQIPEMHAFIEGARGAPADPSPHRQRQRGLRGRLASTATTPSPSPPDSRRSLRARPMSTSTPATSTSSRSAS